MQRFLCAVLLLVPVLAWANDTVFALAAGQVVYKKTDVIAMQEEWLTLEDDRFKIEYRYQNLTDKPQKADIAFPIETYALQDYTVRAASTGYEHNPYGLKLYDEGGRGIPFELQRSAWQEKENITPALKAMGIKNVADEKNFTETQRSQLRKKGWVSQNMDGEESPNWLVKTDYLFSLDFMPRQQRFITHSYIPAATSSSTNPELDEAYLKHYCSADAQKALPEAGAAAVKKYTGKYVIAETIPYILTTAKNWAAQMQKLHLRVIPKHGQHLILCGPDTVRYFAHEREVTLEHPALERDLQLLVLEQK